MTRRMVPLLIMTAALLPGLLLSASQPGALAQGVAIECPPHPAAAASPGGDREAAVAIAADAAFPDDGGELVVFAAASLADAFARIETDIESANPGVTIGYNFGGSQILVTQLSEGAKADVFASANDAQMQAAIDNGSIAGVPVPFARNRLAVVAPAANPARITTPADLARPGLKLVLAQPEVPAGRYARDAVCAMGKDPAAFGEDFVAAVASNIVSEEEDVRDVLAKIQLGEADAGIVYVSDAVIAGDAVALVPIPDAVNVVATYPIAVVTEGDTALAEAFIAYVLSEPGQRTLAEFGFESMVSSGP